MSKKGGGGLGMIDIARKSGKKLEYRFDNVDDKLTLRKQRNYLVEVRPEPSAIFEGTEIEQRFI